MIYFMDHPIVPIITIAHCIILINNPVILKYMNMNTQKE